LKRFSFIVALVAALAVSTVYADHGTEEIQLTADQPSGVGSLIGTGGGSFDYFWFSYVGGDKELVVTINVNHSHHSMGNGIGFNVYDAHGALVGTGKPPRARQSSTYARLPITRISGGRFLIQVYNYVQGAGFNYTIDVAGLSPSQTSSTPQVTGAVEPQDAPTLQPHDYALSGVLEGKPSGAFRYYELNYPGNNLDFSAKLSSTPVFRLSDKAVGMYLYAGEMLVGSSSEAERTKTSVAHILKYRGFFGEKLTLQVYNYGTDHDISYTLFLNGIGGEPTTASGNHSSDMAFQIAPHLSSVVGTLPGSRGGAFSFFDIPHPGGWSRVTIIVQIERENKAIERLTGFNIYENGKLTRQQFASRDGEGRLLARTSVSRGEPVNLGVQLFNYNEGVTIHYRIDVFGLK
jgi:hypothetical protein